MICKNCSIEKNEIEFKKICKNGKIIILKKCKNCREEKLLKKKKDIKDGKKNCQRCNVYKDIEEYEKVLNIGEIKIMSKCIECRKICKKIKNINKN